MDYNTRKFSEIYGSEQLQSMLLNNSVSDVDAQMRLSAYSKAFSNLDNLTEKYYSKKFSGTGIGDLAGLSPNQFIDVTVSTMLNSYVPFLAIERGLDSPTAVLPFMNVVSTYDDRVVSPNIGADTGLASAQITYPDNNATKSKYQFVGGTSLVPSTVKIEVIKGDGTRFDLVDDGKGNLLAPSEAKLSKGTVNYKLGSLVFEFSEDLGAGSRWVLNATKDTPANPDNRVKGSLDYYQLTTYPQTIISENNLVTNMVAEKSMGIDMKVVLKRRVAEEYLKMKNASVVNAIVNGYTGDTISVDLSRYDVKYNSFESYVRLFSHGLTQVDTELTSKSWKSVRTSAYLVGFRVAEIFKSCGKEGLFVPNTTSGYIDDLVGYYNGIPVIQSHKVAPNDGYAIHKTTDGTLAPVAYGIFLPVNDLPEVGNFANPTQSASGIFSYEGVKLLTSELVQKFTVTLPVGLNVITNGGKPFHDYKTYSGIDKP